MKRHDSIHTLGLALCAGALLAVGLLWPATAMAQNGFNMPYSQFGLGLSQTPYNLPTVTRMGGVTYTRGGSNYVNPFNPASYGAVEMESFVFDMGVEVQMSTLRDNVNSQFDADGNLGYLLVAMPLTRWWKLAGGLMPYSTVNYESVVQQNSTTYPGGLVKTVYDGTGGINEVFLGMAFNVLRGKGQRPDLQLGFNVNYITGDIQRNILYTFPGSDSTYYMPSRRYKSTELHNVTFDLGLQMRQPLGSRYTLGLGAVYKPYRDLRVQEEAMVYTYHTGYEDQPIDIIFPQEGNEAGFESRMEQAHTVGVGLSLERNKQWQLAVDATFADWQGMRYTEGQTPSILGVSALTYGPYSRYAVGFEKMGNMDAASYWGRISWSLGVHAEQGVLRLNLGGTEHRVDEWGGGLGATLPMRKGKSLLTLSVGYSSLGSREVLQRNTLTFGIAVSSCERWFFKRKYD